MELKLRDKSGNLPTTTFELFDNDVKIGKIQIRYKVSKSETMPEGFESHIYYEIIEEFRGKNYGNEILKLGLEKAKEIGLKELILTVDEENVASRKIIESNGVVFVEKGFIKNEEKSVFKYKINL
jgi:predicted acetyltransferase